MSRIITQDDLRELSLWNENKIDSSLWTCVIPAAGKGTRLGCEFPKILYPILGQSILQHLVNIFRKYCNHFVVVASPDGALAIRNEFERLCQPCSYKIVIQNEPKGMAHAVWQTRKIVKTPHTTVVWGDQICLRDATILNTLACHQSDSASVLTFPTVMKKNPYIHFQRDNANRIVKVLQKRENEISTEVGENDCGFFCFSTRLLFSILKKGLDSSNSMGAKTKEVNLLQLLPQFEMKKGQVNTLRIAKEEETLGVNTVKDAQSAESILRKRK